MSSPDGTMLPLRQILLHLCRPQLTGIKPLGARCLVLLEVVQQNRVVTKTQLRMVTPATGLTHMIKGYEIPLLPSLSPRTVEQDR